MASRMPRLAMHRPGSGAFASEDGRQAAGIVLTGRPAALMAPLETIQASGWPGTELAARVPTLIDASAKNDGPLTTVRSGGMRCGRTHSGMATWTATIMARVTAMAGTVRRMRAPVAVPRAKPNAA